MTTKRILSLILFFPLISTIFFISGCGQQGQSPEPTASPGPFSGKVVLDDPLHDNSRGYKWDEGNFGAGSCQFKAGTYHAIIPQSEDEVCVAEGPTFANLAFQVNMVILSGDGGGILFRLHTTVDSNGNVVPLSFYDFTVYSDGSYKFLVYSAAGSGVQPLKSGVSSVIHTGLNQANLIEVVAQGSSFSLYVNNHLLTSVSDSSFSNGQIAVLADSQNNPTDVAFSDAKVWQ